MGAEANGSFLLTLAAQGRHLSGASGHFPSFLLLQRSLLLLSDAPEALNAHWLMKHRWGSGHVFLEMYSFSLLLEARRKLQNSN